MSKDSERCRVIKRGRVDLACDLAKGHDGWHRAEYTDRQEIVYPGAHHVVQMTESVTWEQADHVAAAASHLTAAAEERVGSS